MAAPQIDPVFVEVARAVFGEAVEPVEVWLSKNAPDAADVHVDNDGTKKKALAAGLLTGAVIEGFAAKDTIDPLRSAIDDAKPALKAAKTLGEKVQAAKPLVGTTTKKTLPKSLGARQVTLPKRGAATNAVLQAGNFGVGLGAARELAKPKNPNVNKGIPKVRLRPLGLSVGHPSLKARKAPGAPSPVAKSFTAWGEISKTVEEKHQVFGWASVSELDGREVEDRQGDIVPTDELENAAYRYVLDCRVGGDEHQRIAKAGDAPLHTADLIESMVFTDEKVKALGLPDDFPRGWWVGFHVHDDNAWNEIKAGKRRGFSIHGSGKREEMAKSVKDRTKAAVHPPAVALHPVRSSAVAAMGYQRQSRRMAYALRSKPDNPYEYRMSPREAHQAEHPTDGSLGRYYAKQVKGHAPRHDHFTIGDRARLFANPPAEQTAIGGRS